MKEKVSLIKKIKLFREYKTIIKTLKNQINTEFGARVDNAYRIYNVINIPSDIIPEPYNLRKSDVDQISQNFIKEYSIAITEFLTKKGLSQELFDFYEVKKLDKYSFLVIIGFSLFESNKYYDNIRFKVIPSITTLLLTIILILLLM